MAARTQSQFGPELLHAAVEIDPHGTVCHPSSRRDFGSCHAFDEAQDQGFALGIRQAPDEVEHFSGRAEGIRHGGF